MRGEMMNAASRQKAGSQPCLHLQTSQSRGGSPNMFDPFPDKPKEMHWSTYQRLRLEAEEAWERSLPPWFWRPS
jgi:hypothetical protein